MKRAAFILLLGVAIALPLSGQGHSGSCACGAPSTPIVTWEIDHPDAYRGAAEAEFERWNQYIDIFRYAPGDDTMAPNGKNEIGFAGIARVRSLYGVNINRDTFGFAFITPEAAYGDFNACPRPPLASCGKFVETDVIMNSDFSRGFKAEGPIDFDDARGPAFYGATAVHELGHTLGFHHNFVNQSVMNYYEDFAAQYIAASDVAAIGEAYPGRLKQVADAATYPFYFDADGYTYSATIPVSVPESATAGEKLTVRAFGFENVGTLALRGVQMRLYLSRDAAITTSDRLLGTISFDEEVKPGAYWDDRRQGVTFDVPKDMPPAAYYVGAIVTHDSGTADAVTYNNSWVAPQTVTISGSSARKRPVRR